MHILNKSHDTCGRVLRGCYFRSLHSFFTKTGRKIYSRIMQACEFQQIPIMRGCRGEMQIYTDTIFRKLNSAHRGSARVPEVPVYVSH